jgi:hypothetical protein
MIIHQRQPITKSFLLANQKQHHYFL